MPRKMHQDVGSVNVLWYYVGSANRPDVYAFLSVTIHKENDDEESDFPIQLARLWLSGRRGNMPSFLR
jgi:hypothetical protein